MKSDEPFTVRTVAVTTFIGLIVFGGLILTGVGSMADTWAISSGVTTVLFVLAGVILQANQKATSR